MVRRRRDAAKQRFWRAVLARQRRSGQTIRGFCRQEGLSEAGFHWWRRELAGRGTPRTTGRRLQSSTKFVPITVMPPASPSAAYEVVLPSGVRVLVHTWAGEQRLGDVLAALERPAC